MKNKLIVLSLALFVTGSITSAEDFFIAPEFKPTRVTTALALALQSKMLVPTIEQKISNNPDALALALQSKMLVPTIEQKISNNPDALALALQSKMLVPTIEQNISNNPEIGIIDPSDVTILSDSVGKQANYVGTTVAMGRTLFPEQKAFKALPYVAAKRSYVGAGVAAGLAGTYGMYKYLNGKNSVINDLSQATNDENASDINALVCNYDGQPYFGQPSRFEQAKLAVMNNPKKSAGIALGSAALVGATVYLYKNGYFKNPFAKAAKPVIKAVEVKEVTPAAVKPVKKQVAKTATKKVSRSRRAINTIKAKFARKK